MDPEQVEKQPASRVSHLVKQAMHGDMEAFETLFASAEESLYRAGLGLTGDPGLAEESLAETALSVVESLGSLRRPECFYTWATRIMLNACHAVGRRRSKVVPIAQGELAEAHEGEAGSPGGSRWSEFQDVRAALTRLAEEHRTVVVLRYLEDMPVAEMADILGVPEGTVKSRLHHALRELRSKLKMSPIGVRAGGASNE